VGGYGPDIEFIDRALEWVFDRLALDTRRLAITGFSDGASYSLPARRRGKPPVFVSHGTHDHQRSETTYNLLRGSAPCC
jgi:phospholipase/carboxylesterase